MKTVVLALLALVGLQATASQAETANAYIEVGDAQSLRCVSASGRTAVYVTRQAAGWSLTTVQTPESGAEIAMLLHSDVKVGLLVQETFPAHYLFQNQAGETLLSVGQTMTQLDIVVELAFSELKGATRYVKAGQQFNTPVTCTAKF